MLQTDNFISQVEGIALLAICIWIYLDAKTEQDIHALTYSLTVCSSLNYHKYGICLKTIDTVLAMKETFQLNSFL